MGLLKRDLARASAKSLPELGGAFCPPTAPLHLQEHASSLQQLAKGYTRETLLLHISPVLYNMAILLPWQLAEQHSRPALHLHPACWPVTLAPYLQCITYTPTSLHSHPKTSSAFSAKPWPTYRHFGGILIHLRLSKWLFFHLFFPIGMEKGKCLEMLLGKTFPKLCWV